MRLIAQRLGYHDPPRFIKRDKKIHCLRGSELRTQFNYSGFSGSQRLADIANRARFEKSC
jgi:hypothetical protein